MLNKIVKFGWLRYFLGINIRYSWDWASSHLTNQFPCLISVFLALFIVMCKIVSLYFVYFTTPNMLYLLYSPQKYVSEGDFFIFSPFWNKIMDYYSLQACHRNTSLIRHWPYKWGCLISEAQRSTFQAKSLCHISD